MKWMPIALIAGASVLTAANLVSSSHDGNTVFLQLNDGSAQIAWLSDSSFRFSRRWGAPVAQPAARSEQSVPLKIGDNPDSLTIASKYLLLTISRQGVLLRVAEPDGTPIVSDASEPELRNGTVVLERTAAAGVRFYGLGPRDDAAVELRGQRVSTARPFLISSAGYGEYHVAPGSYSFDLARAKPDRYRVEARGPDSVDYYFFLGPTPKEILEQYLLVHDPLTGVVMNMDSRAETIHSLINGSLAGILMPAQSLDRLLKMPNGLSAYFATYTEETRDRGLPFLRALFMQFPKDERAASVADEFMLGDELLAAPIDEGGNSRAVYLPMGIWTRLGDSQAYPGKQTITIEGKPGELVLFSRNGSILPLGSDPMTLHYYPRLGGEFFLFESELEDYSQVHAAPAGDFMRLEIESKIDRDYEWIVHHVERPRKVARNGVALQPAAWFHDARDKSLHVRIFARAGADEILNISF